MIGSSLIQCHDIDKNIILRNLSELSFRPSIYGVIVENGKVLLAGFRDGWDFPGGGIHMGETFDETLEREVREETGLSVKRDKLLHVANDFFVHGATQKAHHTILLFYTCKDISGNISSDGFTEYEKEHGVQAQWHPVANVEKLKFYNPVDSLALIRLAAAGMGI